MADIVDNVTLYLQLLQAAEHAQACGMETQEESIIEEMDALWKELSTAEKRAVDMKLGMNIGFTED